MFKEKIRSGWTLWNYHLLYSIQRFTQVSSLRRFISLSILLIRVIVCTVRVSKVSGVSYAVLTMDELFFL